MHIKSRIAEFNYSFNGLDTSLVKNSQKITTYYNPFSFIFKKYFSFQICLHLFRLIALNKNTATSAKSFSYQLMLKQKSFEELEIILKQFVKYDVIEGFSISKRRTFKYLRDDEVKIGIKFIK